MPRKELITALLRSFARHRSTPGMPDGHWLPDDVYDEELWSVDQLYMHVITDGTLGVRSERRRGSSSSAATVASCEVDNPSIARDAALHASVLSHLSQTLMAADSAGGSGDAAAPSTPLQALLAESGLDHLHEQLAGAGGFELSAAAADLKASRPAFLTRLKANGVDKLGERQTLANAIAKAGREGRIPSS